MAIRTSTEAATESSLRTLTAVRSRGPALTPQMRRVARLISEGYPTHEIAQKLRVSEAAAGSYVAEVLRFMKARSISEEGRRPWLSPRETQVAHLVVEGRSDREIAELLGISVRTAEDHVYRILTKLGLSRRQQLRSLLEAPETTR